MFMTDDPFVTRRKLNLCAIQKEGFRWVANSCYLDTVLWVLFSSPIPFVDKKILFSRPSMEEMDLCGNQSGELFHEFQKMFQRAAHYFRCGVGRQDCSSFRRLYRKWYKQCPQLQNKVRFHSGEQQEAQEFLQFLLGLYGMNGMERGAVSQETFHYGVSSTPRTETEWTFIRHRKDRTQSLIWNVPYQTLRHTSPRNIENFLERQDYIWNVPRQHQKCHFNAVRTTHKLVKFANLLVVSLERTNPLQNKISHYRVDIPQTLTDDRGKTVHLFGLICHLGDTPDSGHYIAYGYSSTNDKWYYYDDMDPPVQEVGTWDDMKKIRRVHTHCVLLFYTKEF